jgi:hypothetical protein
MPTRTFTNTIDIKAPADKVRAFLADFPNFQKVHPLIIQIEEIDGDGQDGRRYLITDRVPIGPFSTVVRYTTLASRGPKGEIILKGSQPMGVRVDNTITVTSKKKSARVLEMVEIEAPGLLIDFAYGQALDSHRGMFGRLKSLMEQD